MKLLLLIGVGGAAGAIFRFLLSRSLQAIAPFVFPIGTLAVNVLGSFCIGFLSVLLLKGEMRALLLVGLLGGFTTFSTFSLETLELWESGAGVRSVFYLLLSVAGGLFAAYSGVILGRKI